MFVQGLRDLGWVEGQNLTIEYRFAEGRFQRLPGLAAELVQRKVEVIAATGTPAPRTAQQPTKTIRIVFVAVGDPMGTRLVASLARPGGNMTGLSDLTPELSGKRLELLKETVPAVGKVAVLASPALPFHSRMLSAL